MRAYVLINVKAGKAKEIARRLLRIEGVKSADPCWGLPDIIACVDVKNERVLDELVLRQIQKMPGVEQTDTHIALD